MSELISLKGDPEALLDMLFSIISATNTDPYYHISEIVQNEMDAGAFEINISFVRKGGIKSGKLKKIVIHGNGFGFIESFEHYSSNIGDSIKKYSKEYRDRQAKGLSRGQFCIGLQGFRAISEEVQIVNKTRQGMTPKLIDDKEIYDPNFSKMFKNRKMILKADTLEVKIFEEGQFNDERDIPGVTCSLLYPKLDIKSDKLVKYLAQNKRTELLANKRLKITIDDGTYHKTVKPISYSGECVDFTIEHPKAKNQTSYKGLGEVNATLYFHEEKSGSKIRLDVKKEPIVLDITSLEEFNKPPWNSDCVEGVIEYDRLTKSPLRIGVERDKVFWLAFMDMMEVLGKKVNNKVKEFEEKTKSKRDEQLMKKLDKVMREVRRELDFDTWFNKKVDKKQLGPLDNIKVFPAVANIPAMTTRKVHVRAYDSEGKVLQEKDNINFKWKVLNDLGTVIPKTNGEAIFKAYSRTGATTVQVKVTDTISNKELIGEIEIAITHPVVRVGKLARVKIEPMYSTLPLGDEKEFKAIAEDEDRNKIEKGIEFKWEIVLDETNGASINVEEGESIILSPGKNQGSIRLQVTAYQNGLRANDFAMVTVIERKEKTSRNRKPKNTGLPVPEAYPGANEFPLRHSYLSKNGTILYYNDGHPDYKNAEANGTKNRQRYIAFLYSKELGIKEANETGKDLGEMLLEVLSKIDRMWY